MKEQIINDIKKEVNFNISQDLLNDYNQRIQQLEENTNNNIVNPFKTNEPSVSNEEFELLKLANTENNKKIVSMEKENKTLNETIAHLKDTIINLQNFTLEMAQWVKERISLGDYVKEVPYFYSGSSSKKLNLPNAPDNMKSGNGIGPNEYYKEDNKPVFTNKEKIEIQTTINGYIKSGDTVDDMGVKLGRMSLEKQMSIKQMHQLLTTFESKVKNYNSTSGKGGNRK